MTAQRRHHTPSPASRKPAAGRYAARGVSSRKEDVHRAIRKSGKGLFPKAFCKIVPDWLGGNKRYCIAMHADGAGTKSSLAYLYWKETGDLSVWKDIAHDALVMNTDDLLCVGATGPVLLSSTIGRNSKCVPGSVVEALIRGTEESVAALRKAGIDMVTTGGETADVGDLVRTVIVDSTVACRMKRSAVIDNSRIRPGDVIVGLASSGKAAYEKTYNSGIGSNGLTSARHDVLAAYLGRKYPESYDPNMPKRLVYAGTKKLLDLVRAGRFTTTVGRLLLSPTRTYAPVIVKILARHRRHIHGLVHCTGGGQTKILHFIDRMHVIKDNLFALPPVFQMIREESGTPYREMYGVFNMGHRMELYVHPRYADELIRISASFGVDARVVGRVEKSARKKLTIDSENGTFVYY